ncbi:MAG: TIM barrel protein [Nanopusillaceae archaeon]
MKKVNKLVFGPAGIPISSPKKDTLNGIIFSYESLNLEGFEMEFVYGIKLRDDEAKKISEYVKEKGIILTAHAPYFINLNAIEKSKREKSIQMIVDTAKKTWLSGGYSIVFHPGWYMKSTKEEAYLRVKEGIERVVKILKDLGIEIWIRPETMEGEKKFGSLEEVIRLSKEIENVLPVIDFAHLRYRYKNKDIAFFREILEIIEKELGKEALENSHIHMSGIKMDKAGTHLNLEESDMPWKEILLLLKEFNVKGIVISESPNIEGDAILMMNYYKNL